MSLGDGESSVYGVDYNGKVWCLNSSLQSSAPGWVLLPNPSKVNIKRLVSFSNTLWGIGSDHQVYVYVPKRDIPIRVREEIYENQRWNPVDGFCSHLLPTDRSKFSSEDGTEGRKKDSKLPSDSWQWEGDWQIENTFENQLVAEGWTYAIDFPATYHPEKNWKSCVRRRKLFRHRRYIGTNRWNRIESLHDDHTKDPFIDVAVGGLNQVSNPETCCLWAVSILGEVYFRCDTSISNPEGTRWLHVPIRRGLEACQITVARNGTPFVVTWTGSFIYRIGLTPKNVQGTNWLESNGPPGGLLQLSAGLNTMWAITRDKKCWALKGNWQEVIVQMEPVFDWIEIPGRMKSISVGKSDDIILALSDDEVSCLYQRIGIAPDQIHGQCWKPAFPDVSWDSLSIVSSEVSDDIDGDNPVSLRPEVPQAVPFGATVMDAGPNSFCWVDGSCASSLRMGSESDLEVGEWRENILHDLQKLKVDGKNFPYPDAIETSSVSWSKCARVKFLHMSRKSNWIDGQLEISNNHHLMFHENLEKSWLCAVSDVLSVFGESSGVNTLTCRIRNSLESGVAEFVNFKFLNEKEAEEWFSIISELSLKPQEDFSVANIWLTTHEGESHCAGQIKFLDIPTEAEVITPVPGGDLKLHHPLVRGFLPGSAVNIDITLTQTAQRFSINLQGKDDVNAFHFNPRLVDGHVVRNSFGHSGWGEEEKDGVFPFREGHSYSISIQCTDTHILTTVIEKKHKFIFSFKHRILPKYISNLFIFGDVDVSSVRYDPKFGEENFALELASNTVPGHFWKVEAGSNGSVWALGYDLKVWCYTGATSKHQKSEATLGATTDEQTYYIYENQRWNPLTGFSSHALPTDRHGWTDVTGRVRLEKDEVRPPSGRWAWITDWETDYDTEHGVDESGWQYAVDFPASYHSSKRLNDFVRRRRWKRVCKYTVTGPWVNVPNMKLVDLSIRMNEDCEWEVLGLCESGDAVVRSGITPECPLGVSWESLSAEKPLVGISGWYGQRIWAIGKDGFAYIRYGNAWQLLDRPKGTPLKAIKVGPSAVWAMGTNNALYRRSEVKAVFPEGREWIKVCEDVIQVCMSPDGGIWGLLKTKNAYRCCLSKRMGISQDNVSGLGWELVAEGPWRHCSVAGCFSRNK